MCKLKPPVLLIVLLFLSALSLKAQEDPYYFEWDQRVLEEANTAKNVDYLSQQEKKIIFYANLARMNGPLFAETYLKTFMKEQNIKKSKWYSSLVKELKEQEPMEPLYPEKMLCDAARKHAKDMGATGRKGRISSTGQLYSERTEELKKIYSLLREASHYGFSEGLAIIGDLLVDEEYDNAIHRKRILNPDSKFIGVAIGAHVKYEFISVIEFAGEKIKKEVVAGNLED